MQKYILVFSVLLISSTFYGCSDGKPNSHQVSDSLKSQNSEDGASTNLGNSVQETIPPKKAPDPPSLKSVDQMLSELLDESDCKPTMQLHDRESLGLIWNATFRQSKEMRESETGRYEMFCEMCTGMSKLEIYLPPMEYYVTSGEILKLKVYENLGDAEQVSTEKTQISIERQTSESLQWHEYRYLKIGFAGKTARAFRVEVADFLDEHPELKAPKQKK